MHAGWEPGLTNEMAEIIVLGGTGVLLWKAMEEAKLRNPKALTSRR